MPAPNANNYMSLGWPPQLLGSSSQIASPASLMPQGNLLEGSMGVPDTFSGSVAYDDAPSQMSWNDLQTKFGQVMNLFSSLGLANPSMSPNGMPSMPACGMPSGCTGGAPQGAGATRPGVATLPNDPNAVPVRIIEVGTDGAPDQHSNQVAEIYGHVLGNSDANASVTILGQEDQNGQLPPGGVALPKNYNNKADLDQFIDFKGTYVLSEMAKEINDTPSGVVNASLGWTRESAYMDVISLLKDNPGLAPNMGLTANDLKNVQYLKTSDGKTADNGQIDPKSIPDNVKAKVVDYVDKRFNTPDSAYSKALGIYQAAAHNAATDPSRNVSIVVATANDGKYRNVFTTAKQGSDTNFLALSNDVISVAAADTKGTADLSDDTIADFSSWGDGHYKPTIAANGVNIPTSYGLASGTSFASPLVAAVVTRLIQANPALTPTDIKKILQSSTQKTNASDNEEGAGMLDANKALQLAQQGVPQQI